MRRNKDLLPALGGEAALVAEPTAAIPYISLIVDDVDEDRARAALARLQGPIVRAIGTPAGSCPVPGFQAVDVAGVGGRFTPDRSQLEWIRDGVYRSLDAPGLELRELLTIATSIGVFISDCTSIRCRIFGRAVNFSSGVSPSSSSPRARMVSPCCGQGSIRVTSCPRWARLPPT